MGKKRIKIEIESYGIYSHWERDSKSLPKIKRHTKDIPAEVDIEFGYILSFSGAKGSTISFTIKHPPFCDENGVPHPDFVGEQIINSNQWHFFLGDTIWLPIEDKCGEWELITMLDKREVARMKFNIGNY